MVAAMAVSALPACTDQQTADQSFDHLLTTDTDQPCTLKPCINKPLKHTTQKSSPSKFNSRLRRMSVMFDLIDKAHLPKARAKILYYRMMTYISISVFPFTF